MNAKKTTFEIYYDHDFVPFSFGKIVMVKNEKGEWEKKLNLPKEWQLTTIATVQIERYREGNSIGILTGEKSGITVVDFDTVEAYEKTLAKYPEIKNTMTVRTRKGFHSYFKYDGGRLGTFSNKETKIDVRNNGGFIIAPPTSYTDNEGNFCEYKLISNYDLIDIPEAFHEELSPRKKSPVSTDSVSSTQVGAFERAILDNIDPKYYSSYSDWIKFLWAIKFSFENALQIADEYSKKARGYNGIDDVQKHFDSGKEARIGFPYLLKLSKLSNKSNHVAIISQKFMNQVITPYVSAQIAFKLVDNVVKQNDVLFVCQDCCYWTADKTKGESLAKVIVIDALRKFWVQVQKNITEKEDLESEIVQQKMKKVSAEIIGCGVPKCVNQIFEMFRMYLPELDVEFDNQPYLFCFKNTAFDLRTNTEVVVTQDMYITQNTGYDYVKSTPEQVAMFTTLMHSILTTKDERECYISVLRTCMVGICFEKFVLANGRGGNGKGVLNDLLALMLGDDYYYKGSVATLTQPLKTGANPELANCDKKRCVRFAEVNDGTSLNVGTLKDLTGGGSVNARACYSNNTKVRLQNTTLFECNKKPSLDSRVGEGEIRRFINIVFRSCFTDNADLLGKPGYFAKNSLYKQHAWQMEMRCVMFDYLLQFNFIDIYEPVSVRKQTEEYLFEQDEFSCWLTRHFEVTDDNKDALSLKEMTKHYKDTYLKEGSRAYKKHTPEVMKTMLEDNMKWRQIMALKFHERKKIDGVVYTNSFIGIKRRRDEEEELTEF